jgi:hypothetical protein
VLVVELACLIRRVTRVVQISWGGVFGHRG